MCGRECGGGGPTWPRCTLTPHPRPARPHSALPLGLRLVRGEESPVDTLGTTPGGRDWLSAHTAPPHPVDELQAALVPSSRGGGFPRAPGHW